MKNKEGERRKERGHTPPGRIDFEFEHEVFFSRGIISTSWNTWGAPRELVERTRKGGSWGTHGGLMEDLWGDSWGDSWGTHRGLTERFLGLVEKKERSKEPGATWPWERMGEGTLASDGTHGYRLRVIVYSVLANRMQGRNPTLCSSVPRRFENATFFFQGHMFLFLFLFLTRRKRAPFGVGVISLAPLRPSSVIAISVTVTISPPLIIPFPFPVIISTLWRPVIRTIIGRRRITTIIRPVIAIIRPVIRPVIGPVISVTIIGGRAVRVAPIIPIIRPVISVTIIGRRTVIALTVITSVITSIIATVSLPLTVIAPTVRAPTVITTIPLPLTVSPTTVPGAVWTAFSPMTTLPTAEAIILSSITRFRVFGPLNPQFNSFEVCAIQFVKGSLGMFSFFIFYKPKALLCFTPNYFSKLFEDLLNLRFFYAGFT